MTTATLPSQRELCENELRSLEKKGVLQAEQVVSFAINKKTALHSEFEWDDTKAGYQYRLGQARKIIVSVIIVPMKNKPIQAYVSLVSDRVNPGGGYRRTETVLSNKELRAELLLQAIKDFEYWRDKYELLNELVPIFEAAKKVKKKL